MTVQDRHTQRGIEMDRIDEAVEVACASFYGDDWLCDGDEGHNGVINNQLRDQMRAALLAGVKVLLGEPVAWQYQGRAGEWRGFVNDDHRINTVADGTWPIRALYAPSLGEGDGR